MTEQALATRSDLAITPTLLGMFMQVDEQANKSGKFGLKQGETFVKLLACYEMGLPLTTAISGLYTVNGRFEVEGRVLAAMFRKHPHYDYAIKEHTWEKCVIQVLFDGDVIGETVWDEEHTVAAGLADKAGPWQTARRNMVFYKAITLAYRFYAPDLTMGPALGIFEDMIGVEGHPDEVWQIVDAVPPTATASTTTPSALTLDDLLESWTPQEIMEANGGQIPQTTDELLEVRDYFDGLAREVAAYEESLKAEKEEVEVAVTG